MIPSSLCNLGCGFVSFGVSHRAFCSLLHLYGCELSYYLWKHERIASWSIKKSQIWSWQTRAHTVVLWNLNWITWGRIYTEGRSRWTPPKITALRQIRTSLLFPSLPFSSILCVLKCIKDLAININDPPWHKMKQPWGHIMFRMVIWRTLLYLGNLEEMWACRWKCMTSTALHLLYKI